ncbi:MAG: ABC transporter permease subunit [Bacilli bacterium]|jgi:phosphonate transport system permease protein|nr:ABC transporter permease subunit [Bacilli bacterium]MCH4210723.1 ABC transporter permease subunit [Bacilli bacterium]MCH4228242.1 ABC transporter permease subunit [Bacilli bacterium]MCH4278006.1 ABC transporter permease subunit [Bacilli bacterium]
MEQSEKKTSIFPKASNYFTGDKKGLTHYKDPVSAYQARPHMWIVTIICAIVFILLVLYMNNDISILDCFDRPIPWNTLATRMKNFFTPDWDYFFGTSNNLGGFENGVVYNCFVTLCLTIIATFIAFVLSIPLGLLASHRLFGKWAFISEILLILIRTFPEILLGLFLIRLSGQTSFTAILALSLHSLGMIGKLYSDQINEADLTSMEALEASGAGKIQTVRLSVLPQVFPSFLSVGLYRLDINIRTGTMLGIILGKYAGIGYYFNNDYGSGDFTRMGADTLGIVLMIIVVDLLSSWLRKKLV